MKLARSIGNVPRCYNKKIKRGNTLYDKVLYADSLFRFYIYLRYYKGPMMSSRISPPGVGKLSWRFRDILEDIIDSSTRRSLRTYLLQGIVLKKKYLYNLNMIKTIKKLQVFVLNLLVL
jgi:hypothetical protein